MKSEMQTAESFQESTVREFIQACNVGNLDDIICHLHPSVHYQSYAGGLPDVVVEGIENLRFYLEGRSVTQDYQYIVHQLENKGKDVRVFCECCVTTGQQQARVHSSTLICIFAQGKIIQLLETA